MEYRGPVDWLFTFQARFWILAALASGGLALRWQKDPYLAALSFVTLLMAINARRFIPLFTLCSLPWMVICVDLVATRLAPRLPRSLAAHGPALRAAGALAVAGTALAPWTQVQMWPDPLGRWTQRDLYPDAAVQYLRSLGRPLRILNHYNWGGYLMLHLPGCQIFMDGRANTLYDDSIYEDWKAFLNGGPGLRTRLARYSADLAVLPDQTFARTLVTLPRPWKVVYRDPIAVILVPPGSPLQPNVLPSTEVIAQHPQFLLQRARERMERGQWHGAEELLREALRRDPLTLHAYSELAAVQANRGDAEGLEAVLDEARRAGRRRWQSLRVIEGYFLAQKGDFARAIHALRDGLPRGPFEDPQPVLERIRAIEPRTSGAVKTAG